MLTITQAVNKFEKENPDRKVLHAGHYKDGYIFVAPAKGMGDNDTTNPVYFIKRDGGEFIRKSPVEDLEGINKALVGEGKVF